MSAPTHLAYIGHLVGDPARARILLTLMDGRAHTAKELAFLARIAAPTASGHLLKLLDGGLVRVAQQGRHRYYRLASSEIAQMIELMGVIASDMASPAWPVRIDARLRTARTCYDHIAGRLGVALADALQKAGHLRLGDGAGEVSASGRGFFRDLGIDLNGAARSRRAFCRPCLDWSERRDHLAGAVGAALCDHCLAQGWTLRERDTRALQVTESGRDAFRDLFGIDVEAFAAPAQRAA
ncbi:ArsR/SmtB family transcription factor [Chelatococcus sp. GCM10030263]|uniref:ArsR/SmtB family transcription factor n=1 Tax=Chelatococcus sp. GCM10030263 TaxID=3273387 RepID=UPI00361F4CA0